MARFVARLFGVLFVVLAGTAAAEIPGRDQPAFDAALETWLADDEIAGLPALAELAGEGNAAAKMLLALIDRTPALQGPWLSRLSPDDRRAILRAPGRNGGGGSWMAQAVASEPSAALWIAHWHGEATADLALAFAAAGEPRAAREVLLARAVQRRRGLAERVSEPHFPPELRVLALLDPAGPPADGEIPPFAPGDPQQAFLNGLPSDLLLGQWLMTAPVAAPVAELCRTACGGAPSCAIAAFRAVGGYSGLLLSGSPIERLIDAGRFARSPRGQYAFLRRALLRKDARGRGPMIAEAKATDACFGALLEAEAKRYSSAGAAPDQEGAPADGPGSGD